MNTRDLHLVDCEVTVLAGVTTQGVVDLFREPLSQPLFGIAGKKVEECRTYPFIANPICELIQDGEFREIFSRSTLTVRNTTSILSLVAANAGITVLPRLAVTGDGANVSFLPLAYDGIFRELHLMKRANTTPTPVAKAFIDELLKEVDEDE